MLVLSRRPKQAILIDDGERKIVVSVNWIKGRTVSVGIEAPRDVRVVRSELERRGESDAA